MEDWLQGNKCIFKLVPHVVEKQDVIMSKSVEIM